MTGQESLFPDIEMWPCGCAKGMTPHGAGWSDCIFSAEQKAKWRERAVYDQGFEDGARALIGGKPHV